MSRDPASVSVVIPAYNAQRWIGAALRSVFAQAHRPLEVVVVDDGSTDATAPVVEAALAACRAQVPDVATQLIRQPNRGGNAARNEGWRRSRGELLRFLDADDILTADSVGRHAALMAAERDLDVVYGDIQSIHMHGERHFRFGTVHTKHAFDERSHAWMSGPQSGGRPPSPPFPLQAWFTGMPATPASVTYRRRVLEAAGGWDEPLRLLQDGDMFVRAALAASQVRYVPGLCGYYRQHDGARVSGRPGPERLAALDRVVGRLVERLRDAGQWADARQREVALIYYLVGVRASAAVGDVATACLVLRRCREWDPGFGAPRRWDRMLLGALPAGLALRVLAALLWLRHRRVVRSRSQQQPLQSLEVLEVRQPACT